MGVLRAVEAVAHIEKECACDVSLKREGGIEATHVVAHIVHIDAKACAHGEDGGANLATHR